MIKEFFMKKMLERQLKNLPKDQQDKIISAVTKNPALFETIAKEIQEAVKAGKPQTAATMEVMRKHQAELQKAMMN